MAITTYAELRTAAADWLHRSDLTSYIPDFITLAETEIFRKLKSKDMETAFSGTISSGVLALPTSYLRLKYAYINTSPTRRLERTSTRLIYEKYPTRAAEGKPAYIAREGSNFIFGPYPDSNYAVAGVYYKNIGPLSSSAHAVFTSNPDLYLFGTLLQATPFMKDDKRLVVWGNMYANALTSANGFSDEEEQSGSPLTMRVG